MRLFAIGDLHLSTSVDKPMTIFGECWKNHEEKIFSNWN
ncbi:MAG: serine/threonine protein phosphatase, partial [Peptostreptococcus porci]|nr:serine/threonine protein phosphatase [Peptostreptococcus porci]